MGDGVPAAGDAVGVVLAGGASRRMGHDKAALTIGGQPLLARVVERLGSVLPSVMVVGPERLQPLVPGIQVVADRWPGVGPLGGLLTALRTADVAFFLVVACDMPFVAPPLVRALLKAMWEDPSTDTVVPRTSRGIEPLHAVYARGCAARAEARLASSDRSLHGLLADLAVRELPLERVAQLDPAGLSTLNANTPEEWEWALALATQEETPSPGGGA
jgi:molybdopterin-guanine dinucleotide biosynthesis protein A